MKASAGWKVEITTRGRTGELLCREEGHELECSWEFEGGESLAVILLPDAPPNSERRPLPWPTAMRAKTR